MSVEITIDDEQFEAALEKLRDVPYAMQRAILPAVSHVLNGIRDQLAEHLESEVPLPAKAAKRAIKLSQPRMDGQSVSGFVAVRSATLPLIYYDVQPMQNTVRKGMLPRQWPGFTYSLRKGERRDGQEQIRGSSLPFIATMPNGHMGVYYRTPTQMKQAYGPTVQYHIATPDVENSIVSKASLEFPEILDRYVDQALAQYGGAE